MRREVIVSLFIYVNDYNCCVIYLFLMRDIKLISFRDKYCFKYRMIIVSILYKVVLDFSG